MTHFDFNDQPRRRNALFGFVRGIFKLVVILAVIGGGTALGIYLLETKQIDLSPATENYVDVKPGQKIVLPQFELTFNAVEFGTVQLKDIINRDAKSDQKHLQIRLEIHNTTATKKLDYKSWNGRIRSDSTLVDNFGNSYIGINFGINNVIGAVDDIAEIHPGKTVTDVLVYSQPVANVAHLDLRLKAQNLSLERDLKYRFHKDDWNQFKPR